MSQTAVINYGHLEDFLDNDGPTDEEIKSWYEKLSEHDLDGHESSAELELLYNASRYLMNFAFTTAEELRDVAEHEAIQMAEREDEWVEQRAQLRDEIETLRERITSKAEFGDSTTQAFREQIESLKEENRQLHHANRDRDREMADQRDRFENLAARVDTLTRERDALLENKTHLEDTIRELNRRLSSKTEEIGGDWESKKLRIRNEQVLTISRQMQAVVEQNDELRDKIEQLRDTLEEANRMIDNSAVKISDLSRELAESQKKVDELADHNSRLIEGLPDELVEKLPKCMAAAEKLISGEPLDKINFLWQTSELLLPNFLNDNDYETLKDWSGHTAKIEMEHRISESERRISELLEQLADANQEITKMRSMISEDQTGEKEKELEHLKTELLAATKLARNLFGEIITDTTGNHDPTTSLHIRILQLEQLVEELNGKLEKREKLIEELKFTNETKDETNSDLLMELNRLKEIRFGSAREEIEKIETQLKFRDEQISKLRQHCTLLNIELGRYADNTYESPIGATYKKTPNMGKPLQKTDRKVEEQKVKPVLEIKGVQTEIEENPTVPRSRVEFNLTEISQQAVLISNLYYEIMQLLEEIEIKDQQFKELHNSWARTKKDNDLKSSQLEMAYNEIKTLRRENNEIEERTLGMVKNNESIEFQRLIDSIQMNGTEMERRFGETTRKLICERMSAARLSRQCAILKSKLNRIETAARKSRDTARLHETEHMKTITKMKYDFEITIIEIGKLQTRLLQSVPIEDYEALMRKYKIMLKQMTGIEGNYEEIPRPSLAFSSESPQESQENMLKKMIDVVSDQSEFWRREAASLQAENEELKKFLEDIENESDLKSVLGAVERRLLDTIRDLRENERDHIRERKKLKVMEFENSRDLKRAQNERNAHLDIIRVLQKENKTLREQSLGTISTQQLDILRSRIIDIQNRETELNDLKQEIEKMKQDTESELLQARAIKTTSQVLLNNESDLSRQLQIAYYNSAKQSAKVKNLEKTVHFKERQMTDCYKEMEEIKKWNIDLIMTIERFKDFKESNDRKPSVIEKPAEELISTIRQESDYEMDIRSEESSSEISSSDRVVVRTIVQDNSELFENRVKEIKSAAQVALQGYKDQLELKNQAIERYKRLLQEKIDEGVHVIERVEVVHKEVEVPDKDILEKLRIAQEYIAGIEKQQTIEKFDQDCQTENIFERKIEEKEEEHTISRNNSNIEETSTKLDKVRKLEEEISIMQEMMLEKDSSASEVLRQKSEIRDLKSKIQKLAKTNKQLMITCEQIKQDAIEELSTFRKNNQNYDHQMVNDLRTENERLKSINQSLRESIENLKQEMVNLKAVKDQEKLKNRTNQNEWEKRKKMEEIIQNLKEKLKRKEMMEKEIVEKIEKRDKVIETMRNDQGIRTIEIEKLQKKIRQSDPHQIRLQINASWEQKYTELEERISRKEQELHAANRIINTLKSELESSKLAEKRRDSKEIELEKEVTRLRAEAKKTTPKRDGVRKMVTKGVQVDQIIAKEELAKQQYISIEEYTIISGNLKMTENRLIESQKRLIEMERNYSSLNEKFENLKSKIHSRDEKPSGAILVLSDKLGAKDREISQLKNKIAHLQRSVHLGVDWEK